MATSITPRIPQTAAEPQPQRPVSVLNFVPSKLKPRATKARARALLGEVARGLESQWRLKDYWCLAEAPSPGNAPKYEPGVWSMQGRAAVRLTAPFTYHRIASKLNPENRALLLQGQHGWVVLEAKAIASLSRCSMLAHKLYQAGILDSSTPLAIHGLKKLLKALAADARRQQQVPVPILDEVQASSKIQRALAVGNVEAAPLILDNLIYENADQLLTTIKPCHDTYIVIPADTLTNTIGATFRRHLISLGILSKVSRKSKISSTTQQYKVSLRNLNKCLKASYGVLSAARVVLKETHRKTSTWVNALGTGKQLIEHNQAYLQHLHAITPHEVRPLNPRIYGHYGVTSLGYVVNLKNGYVLKGSIQSRGYAQVRLKGKSYLVHQLVMEAYQNLSSCLIDSVDHINGDRLNNRPDNLRPIFTPGENQRLGAERRRAALAC